MTDRYVVFGNPVSHSKSPLIHAEFARQAGQSIDYAAQLVPLDGFAAAVNAFRATAGRGANVTVPFKEEAYRLADTLSARATAAKAVNTLSFHEDGIDGDNTDGVGLVTDLQHNLDCEISGKRVLLVGAGGAARGVILPLLDAQPQQLVIANRTAPKAHALHEEFTQVLRDMGLPHAAALLADCELSALAGQRFDIVINATAASLTDQAPALPPGIYATGSLAYDMVYGKGLTPFLLAAQAQGAAQLADGLGMLVEQAAESFFVWRGVRPQTAPVLKLLRSQ